MRKFILITMLLLGGCSDDRKEYGLQFDLFCPNSILAAEWTTDKNGHIKSMRPGFWTSIFIPYGGGMFENGVFRPFDWPDCQVSAKATTLVNGFPAKVTSP